MKHRPSIWSFAHGFIDEAIRNCGGELKKTETFKTRVRYTIEGDLNRIADFAQQRLGHYAYNVDCWVGDNGKVYIG